jgi:hypothetical protein
MPMASGGGGNISRLSMTCTRAKYPTARTTLTTPAERWRESGVRIVRRERARNARSVARGGGPRGSGNDPERWRVGGDERRTGDDGCDLRALHFFVVAEFGERQLLGLGRFLRGLVVLHRAPRAGVFATRMGKEKRAGSGRARRECGRNARSRTAAGSGARAHGDDGGLGDGKRHRASSCEDDARGCGRLGSCGTCDVRVSGFWCRFSGEPAVSL